MYIDYELFGGLLPAGCFNWLRSIYIIVAF